MILNYKTTKVQKPSTRKYFLTNKRLILLIIFHIKFLFVQGQIGIQTDNPDPSSAIDIVANNRGILIPRIVLSNSLLNPSPVTSPANGLLVYNSGVNQPIGFYYWNGTQWTQLANFAEALEGWSTIGNAGTTAGTNFLGTTDNVDFSIFTNNTERIRVANDGQIIIGATVPNQNADLFTVIGNSTQNSAINAYSNYIGLYSNSGTFGLVATVNNTGGFGVYSKNTNSSGYGCMLVGSNATAYYLTGHSSGLAAHGADGIFTLGQSASSGIGIIAGGNNTATVSTISTGTGGAFTGHHGSYSQGNNASDGTGVIGVGNNGSTYIIATEGSGGSLTGFHGVIASATNSTSGTGIIATGNNISGHVMSDGLGSGAAFTGYRTGMAAWADNANNNSVGVFGQYNGTGSNSDGTGVKGIALANSGRGYGVYGQGNRYGLYSNGNTGASGTKAFVIDHPLDPENKILKHYSIESPEVLNLYRGNIVLDNSGTASINLPDYFIAINTNFSYTLTAIGVPSPNLFILKEIDQYGQFIISGGNPNQKISWVVYAERNDLYLRKYPESKSVEVQKDSELKGKYIRPELFNQPAEKGMFYTSENRNIIPSKEFESTSTSIEKIQDVPNK